ncbi:MAG: hypothetical protein ACFCGT_28370 [Sandaracinaceae bacterium]
MGWALALLLVACGGTGTMDAGPDDDGGGDPPDLGPVDLGGNDDMGMEGRSCLRPANANPAGTDVFSDDGDEATVVIDGRSTCARTYTLETTASLRDNQPENPRTIVEGEADPLLRSGHDILDALYALALLEARQNEATEVTSPDFNEGEPVTCTGGCYSISRIDTFVRTREAGWALWLGLAPLDPVRARNTLEFQLSERRDGGDLQIVPDPGPGGSYAYNVDRVVWALAAWEVLNHLPDADRADFQTRAFQAVAGTLDRDREVAFDPQLGLYRGAGAFFDGLGQGYREASVDNPAVIARTWGLSSNALYVRALEVGARLAEAEGNASAQARFEGWADELRTAIRDQLYDGGSGLFVSFLPGPLDQVQPQRYDLLGSAMAVMFGVGSQGERGEVVESYPHLGITAPVFFPQQQSARINANRGSWPFADATWLRASAATRNDAAAQRMIMGLIRGAAINVSHLQSYEVISGEPFVSDGDLSGPPVSSTRYLPSIGGFLSMIHHTLFGIRSSPEGLEVRPFLTVQARNGLFGGTDQLVLNDYPFRGNAVSVVLNLPETGGTAGAYAVGEVRVDGTVVDGVIDAAMLSDGAVIEVDLDAPTGGRTITVVDAGDPNNYFAPRTPSLSELVENNNPVGLRFNIGVPVGQPRPQVTFNIYQNGTRIASDLPGSTENYVAELTTPEFGDVLCFVAEACFTSGTNCSQRSAPLCWFGRVSNEFETIIPLANLDDDTGSSLPDEPFGEPGDVAVGTFFANGEGTPTRDFAFEVVYRNGRGAVSRSATAAILNLTVEGPGATNRGEYITAPVLRNGSDEATSTAVFSPMTVGSLYTVRLRAVGEAYNASDLSYYEDFTGLTEGPINLIDIVAIQVRGVPIP